MTGPSPVASKRPAPLALVRRVPTGARVGVTIALALLAVFVALLLMTASDRRVLRRQLSIALPRRLFERGADVAKPGASARCRPRLTYRLICAVPIAAGGRARFDLRYGQGGCWTARLISAPTFDRALPVDLSGCTS